MAAPESKKSQNDSFLMTFKANEILKTCMENFSSCIILKMVSCSEKWKENKYYFLEILIVVST